MLGLAQVLLLHQATGSYAAAAAGLGAFSLGLGFGAPFWGRLVDQHGPRAIIGILAPVDGGLLLALALAAQMPVAPAFLILLAALGGALNPPTVPAMRTTWGQLTEDRGQRQAAYALEGALTETAFVSGPLATALIVSIASPSAAVAVGAGFLVGGSLLFSYLAPPAECARPSSGAFRFQLARAVEARVLLALWVALGAAFGALEVVLPALCQQRGSPTLAGVLVALPSAGAALGGLSYGALRPPSSPRGRVRQGSLLFALALVALAAGLALPLLAALLFLAGAAFAVAATCSSQCIDELVNREAATETYAWLLSAYMAGAALGAQLTGAAIAALGVGAALTVPGLFGLISCLPSQRLADPRSTRRRDRRGLLRISDY